MSIIDAIEKYKPAYTMILVLKETNYYGQETTKDWDYIEYFFDENHKEIGYYCRPTKSYCEISRVWGDSHRAAHRIERIFNHKCLESLTCSSEHVILVK